MGRSVRTLLGAAALVVLAACGSGGGRAATDAVSTTTTSSPAPIWLQQKVSQLSQNSGGQKHGTGWLAEFGSRFEAVEAVSEDRIQNTANPPVYVVIVRGDFVSNRSFRDDEGVHGAQLTLVIPRSGHDLAMTDLGIGPEAPPPAASERFSF
jgi:hypothetical protein